MPRMRKKKIGQGPPAAGVTAIIASGWESGVLEWRVENGEWRVGNSFLRAWRMNGILHSPLSIEQTLSVPELPRGAELEGEAVAGVVADALQAGDGGLGGQCAPAGVQLDGVQGGDALRAHGR